MKKLPKTGPSKPIRILQIVTVMNRGGLETMLMNYYRTIDRSKVQFDFLVHRVDAGAYDDEILSLGGKIYHLPPISLKNLWRYRNDLKSFFTKHSEYRIVHAHLDSLSALPLSIAKEAGIPTRLAHSHTSSFDRDAKFIIRSITKKFIRYYATGFLGCSRESIKMFGNNMQNYTIINNAIDADAFAFDAKKRSMLRKKLNIRDQFVVGHVGRFNYPKNHEFLIDIFKEIHSKNDNSLLLLVGDGEGEPKIKQRVKDLALDKYVRFLGSRSDIADVMQAMDAFVMPSRYEGLPVVSIEAQASGLPCFFSSVVTKDLDVTANCHFIGLDIPARNWAKVILATSGQKRLATKTKIAESHYDVRVEARKLESFYLKKYI